MLSGRRRPSDINKFWLLFFLCLFEAQPTTADIQNSRRFVCIHCFTRHIRRYIVARVVVGTHAHANTRAHIKYKENSCWPGGFFNSFFCTILCTIFNRCLPRSSPQRLHIFLVGILFGLFREGLNTEDNVKWKIRVGGSADGPLTKYWMKLFFFFYLPLGPSVHIQTNNRAACVCVYVF